MIKKFSCVSGYAKRPMSDCFENTKPKRKDARAQSTQRKILHISLAQSTGDWLLETDFI